MSPSYRCEKDRVQVRKLLSFTRSVPVRVDRLLHPLGSVGQVPCPLRALQGNALVLLGNHLAECVQGTDHVFRGAQDTGFHVRHPLFQHTHFCCECSHIARCCGVLLLAHVLASTLCCLACLFGDVALSFGSVALCRFPLVFSLLAFGCLHLLGRWGRTRSQ